MIVRLLSTSNPSPLLPKYYIQLLVIRTEVVQRV